MYAESPTGIGRELIIEPVSHQEHPGERWVSLTIREGHTDHAAWVNVAELLAELGRALPR